MCVCVCVCIQGVVTAACSLLEELARINSLGFMDCVPLAVTRLSRVRDSKWCMQMCRLYVHVSLTSVCVCVCVGGGGVTGVSYT